MQLVKKGNRAALFHSSNILPMFALATLGIQGILLLIAIAMTIGISRLNQKPAPAMVQMVDGRSVSMEPVGHLDRTPEVVRRFTQESLAMMFTWNGKLAKSIANNGANLAKSSVDPGVSVGGQGKVTTSSWQASFALKEDFRAKFLSAVATLTPPEVFAGNAQSVLSFESISQAKLVKPHTWQIDIVSNLVIFNTAHPEGLAVPFNKSVFVEAIAPTPDPLDNQSTPIQQAVYRIKQSGLQITELRDLDIQQINQQQ